ncbi:MAG: hypothetical protein IT191_01190 [Microbacteriaceae bacterium]|nr:hypothetical protein [Cryobacterium sp.]MCC6375612.1 hypothetical protein [Microbacteriaceae bacterium]
MFADWASKYIDCAREFGADARLLPGGSISNAYAPGRPVKDGLDAKCLEAVGPAPYPPPLTNNFLIGLYELLVKEGDCLRAHGYNISQPPSRQQFVENYGAESWYPLSEVDRERPGDIAADSLCPQPNPRDAEELGNQIANSGS